MTKSKASLKGKGVDILFGGAVGPAQPTPAIPKPDARPVQPAPATNPFAESTADAASPNPFAEPAPAATAPNPFAEPAPDTARPTPLVESPPASIEATPPAESLLAESAVNPMPAAQAFESSPDVSVPAVEPPAVDETSFESEAVSGQPATSASTSLPPEEMPWLADEAAPLPDTGEPAPADSGPVSVPLPTDPTLIKTPKIGGLSMSIPVIPDSDTFEPPTGVTHTGLQVLAVSDVKPVASDAEVFKRLGAERPRALSKRIDELYAQIAGGAIASEARANKAMGHLLKARDKELEDPRQFDEAEYLVNVAQYSVSHEATVAQVRIWSYTWGVFVFLYGLIWLTVFGAGMGLATLGLVERWLATLNLEPAVITGASGFFTSVVAGGLGGVLGLLYSLFKHVAIERDFDRQFLLWYLVQPFMGILMGAIVHLFIVAGLFQLLDATGPAFVAIGALIAIAAAFRQHYVYAWLESLLKAFERSSEKSKARNEASVAMAEASAETMKASAEAATAKATGASQSMLVAMPRSEGPAGTTSEPAGVG
ncbi:MAG TPA: hypothetical protein VJG32_10355 [Anaerolineae bacterium]|nr:hypothetical protein [Anaerolineae bacterium]